MYDNRNNKNYEVYRGTEEQSKVFFFLMIESSLNYFSLKVDA